MDVSAEVCVRRLLPAIIRASADAYTHSGVFDALRSAPARGNGFFCRFPAAERAAKRKREGGRVEQDEQNRQQIDVQPQRVFGILRRFRRVQPGLQIPAVQHVERHRAEQQADG